MRFGGMKRTKPDFIYSNENDATSYLYVSLFVSHFQVYSEQYKMLVPHAHLQLAHFKLQYLFLRNSR